MRERMKAGVFILSGVLVVGKRKAAAKEVFPALPDVFKDPRGYVRNQALHATP